MRFSFGLGSVILKCVAQVCGVEFDRKDIEMNKLVCTTLESQFKVFDMRTYHPKEGYEGLTQKVPGMGVTGLGNRQTSLARIGCHLIGLWGNGFLSDEQAHKSTVWCVRHLPQNRDVWMTTGGNGSLALWK